MMAVSDPDSSSSDSEIAEDPSFPLPRVDSDWESDSSTSDIDSPSHSPLSPAIVPPSPSGSNLDKSPTRGEFYMYTSLQMHTYSCIKQEYKNYKCVHKHTYTIEVSAHGTIYVMIGRRSRSRQRREQRQGRVSESDQSCSSDSGSENEGFETGKEAQCRQGEEVQFRKGEGIRARQGALFRTREESRTRKGW